MQVGRLRNFTGINAGCCYCDVLQLQRAASVSTCMRFKQTNMAERATAQLLGKKITGDPGWCITRPKCTKDGLFCLYLVLLLHLQSRFTLLPSQLLGPDKLGIIRTEFINWIPDNNGWRLLTSQLKTLHEQGLSCRRSSLAVCRVLHRSIFRELTREKGGKTTGMAAALRRRRHRHFNRVSYLEKQNWTDAQLSIFRWTVNSPFHLEIKDFLLVLGKDFAFWDSGLLIFRSCICQKYLTLLVIRLE